MQKQELKWQITAGIPEFIQKIGKIRLEYLPEFSFYSRGLKEIVIGKSVCRAHKDAVAIFAIGKITVSKDNPHLIAKDGNLYDKIKKKNLF